MSDTDKIDGPIYEITNGKHSALVFRLSGRVDILDALVKRCKEKGPGAGFAIAVAESLVADLRAELAGVVLREAAKHGHDITKVKNVFSAADNYKAFIQVEEYDLADLAEG